MVSPAGHGADRRDGAGLRDGAGHSTAPVTIVGAGIAGAACAVALRERGIPVRVIERGRAPGGRLASPVLHGRRVDLGAGYFTVRDAGFAAVVEAWQSRGLARPWTDTFAVLSSGQQPTTRTGPMRWATPGGLRSLVRDLLTGIEVQTGSELAGLPAGQLVLAMPDPQAARLVRVPDPVGCRPTIAVACGFADRDWPFDTAAFVNDHAMVEFIADDGSRRGDGAAVLVAHSSAELAEQHLAEPAAAIGPVLGALSELLGVGEPLWTHAHRWSLAKPAGQHPATYGFAPADTADSEHQPPVGLAGDQWCPDGSPRVESAWRSGTDLGISLAAGRAAAAD